MEKAPGLAEWGFIPSADPEKERPHRRNPVTVVDERGREITAAEAVDADAEQTLEPPRQPLPWGLVAISLVAVATATVAAAAAWNRAPSLSDTPPLELSRSDEPSEIWTEAASVDALARTRAAIAAPIDLDQIAFDSPSAAPSTPTAVPAKPAIPAGANDAPRSESSRDVAPESNPYPSESSRDVAPESDNPY